MPGNTNSAAGAGPQPESQNQTAQSGHQNEVTPSEATNPLRGLTSTAPNPNAQAIIEAMAPPNPVVTNTEQSQPANEATEMKQQAAEPLAQVVAQAPNPEQNSVATNAQAAITVSNAVEKQPDQQQPQPQSPIGASTAEADATKKVLSQQLWGKSAPIEADAAMADEEDSNYSADPSHREQCRKLQDSDGLFNLEANNLMIAILNGKLSSLNLRLDCSEQVLATKTKREKEKALRDKEERKRQAKEAKQQAQRSQRDQAREAKRRSKMASARDDSESSYEQEANKRLNLQSKTEVVINEEIDPSALDDHPAATSPSGDRHIETGGLNDSQIKEINGQIAENSKGDVDQPSVAAGLDDSSKFEQKSLFPVAMDSSGLSPTPRKSERPKTSINYTRLASGYKEPLNDLDEHLQSSKLKQRDSEKLLQVEKTKSTVDELFKKLLAHEAAEIMTSPADKNNPKYDEFKSSFKNLLIIEMTFKTGAYYANTNDLIKDVDLMILAQFNMLAAAGSADFGKVKTFSDFFKSETEALKDLPLIFVSTPVPKAPSTKQNTAAKLEKKASTYSQQQREIVSKPKKAPQKKVDDEGFRFRDAAEKDALGKEIQQLDNAQKLEICEKFPEFVQYDEKNVKTLTLSKLPQHPEQAKKLMNYVKDQNKKNAQRKRRQVADAARREEKKRQRAAAEAEAAKKQQPDGNGATAPAAETGGQGAPNAALVQALLTMQQPQGNGAGGANALAALASVLQQNNKDGAGGLSNANVMAVPNALQLLMQAQGANNGAGILQAQQVASLLAQGGSLSQAAGDKKGKADGANGAKGGKRQADSSSSESESDDD